MIGSLFPQKKQGVAIEMISFCNFHDCFNNCKNCSFKNKEQNLGAYLK